MTAKLTSDRPGATLEPVRVGPVIVHEWVYNVQEASNLTNTPAMALSLVRYHERVLYKAAGEDTWRVMDGRLGLARWFRKQAKR